MSSMTEDDFGTLFQNLRIRDMISSSNGNNRYCIHAMGGGGQMQYYHIQNVNFNSSIFSTNF